ncbi:MAG: putative transport system permease protein [Actinomycetota bacterium]|jgi:putative ABC transport system permease protein|nr:putative transport system permease protein [Actinomycetota bacterium]
MRDLLVLAGGGLRARRLRSILSAAGIALGIAAMVAVLGISASSRTNLLAELDALGTNLLTVEAGQTLIGGDAKLPETAPGMIGRIGPVQSTAATARVSATVRRTDHIPEAETGGIAVRAAQPGLASTLRATVRAGRFLDGATDRYPAVVLGSVAADRLGIDRVGGRVWLGGRWFTVTGILDPVPLAPEIDRSALIGFPVAESLLGADGAPGTVYLRADPSQVDAVRSVLAPTTNPRHPEEVRVSRPSDALAARSAAGAAFTGLLLGLGAVALVVGGVGVANVMVVSVLERRPEIGLRRALGATRGDVRRQFLAESLLLSGAGGAGGVAMGAAITAAYAAGRSWGVAVPVPALAGAMAAALLIGAVAGLYPALRAARLAPTDALRT